MLTSAIYRSRQYWRLLLLSLSLTMITSVHAQSPQQVRFATYNVSMDASNYLAFEDIPEQGANALASALAEQSQQIKNIAHVIQRVRPDVILLNEFDYIDAAKGVDVFRKQYLAVAQADDVKAVDYPYVYIAPVNTGQPSPFDLDRNGKKERFGADAWGFGLYPGQYGMVLLSRYPILTKQVRTFQHFKWQDMPNALQVTVPGSGEPWYSKQAMAQFPLSSKSHWDVPIRVGEQIIHALVSHPTPPVFDGEENRNGKRNHDEIRLWADYVNDADYLIDDNGVKGGLASETRFVIMGDQNASVESNDNVDGAILQLLNHPLIQGDMAPTSKGGAEHTPNNPQANTHTASWRKRADYVLPSQFGLTIVDSGIFWPTKDEPLYELVQKREATSDHRLVWVDLKVN